MSELNGRSAIVSGAGRGFGRAIGTALAHAGANVTLVARTIDEIRKVADEIRAAGGNAQAIVGDIGDLTSIRDAYAQHVAAYGPTSILVSSAGVSDPIGPVGDIDVDVWWNAMMINVRAPLQWMSLAIPDMRRVGRGTVINVGSIAGLAIIPFNSGYTVSKAALYRLSEHVAAESKEASIGVFPVHPGIVFTRLMEESVNDEMRRWMPGMAEQFEAMRGSAGGESSLQRCADHCVALATGKFDHLAGKFLDLSVPDLQQSVVTSFEPPGSHT